MNWWFNGPVKLIRLECFSGYGIYSKVSAPEGLQPLIQSIRDLLENHFGTLAGRNHPDPLDDLLLKKNLCDKGLSPWNTGDGRFGFSSRKQLLNWFDLDVLKKLGEMGVSIVHYEVESIIDGLSQCIVIGKHWETRKEVFRMNVKEYAELLESNPRRKS